ncbi:hypothetical protein TeGR_g1396, partial [Tetraparma gracilis]
MPPLLALLLLLLLPPATSLLPCFLSPPRSAPPASPTRLSLFGGKKPAGDAKAGPLGGMGNMMEQMKKAQ